MLDEFRSTLITWDKATSRIYSPVTANASDENGRKLVVQIVNGGQVEDLTGATLHLYWETRDKAHDGLDVFDAVDLKKGEFELSYTTGMLSNQGVLNANLVLIDTVGRVVSERFKITVTEGIDNGAIQSENSFSSLTQALIDVSNLEQNYAPRLNDLTAQLQHMEIKVFEELPSTSQLKEGEFGFVIDVAQQQYDNLNLSFERLNANNFPFLFAASPVGGGVKINETHLSETKSTDGTFRSMRIGQKGGVDGSSNYSRLNTARVIPLDGSNKILKSDLINFRFSVKPISENCYDGSGTYNGSVTVSFRNGAGGAIGQEASHFFIYDSFSVPARDTANKATMDEWTIVKWDLHEACKKRGVNFDLVEGIVLSFRAYTNHSTSSAEFLIDDISFGV